MPRVSAELTLVSTVGRHTGAVARRGTDASDEEEANDKAGLEAYLGDRDDTWGNTDVTHVDMTVVEVEEINV